MKPINLLAAILLASALLASSSTLYAQDVFRSVGTSTKSYNYIEGQYQLDLDVDNPYTLAGYYSIADNLALRFSYFRVGFLVLVELTDVAPFLVDSAVESTLIGAVYHKPFNYLEGSGLGKILQGADWIAGVDIGTEKISGKFALTNNEVGRVSDSNTIQQIYLGLRKSIGPKLEIQGGLNFVFGSDINENERIDLLAVYRIGKFLDASLGVNDFGDADNVAIGLRYTW